MIITLTNNRRRNNKNKHYKQQRHSIEQESHNIRFTIQSINIPINIINQITHNKIYTPKTTKPAPKNKKKQI